LSRDVVDLRERPVPADGTVLQEPGFRVEGQPLSHSVPAIGCRLQREGHLATADRLVTIDQVSEPRPGQRFAFIMDTRLCDAAFALADGAGMVVCESTFAGTEAALARDYGHLTAGRAGRIAAESGARLLVLTHFSQRYEHCDGQQLAEEAGPAFGGPILLAHDLDRIPIPSRHPPAT
jgi:ribonuclease Z